MLPATRKGLTQLSTVLRQAGDVISVDDVQTALHTERLTAARLLARWRAQGWMKRLRRGYYAPVPVPALGQEQVLDDPWVIVPELFAPACIGGWSAAEHWGLTEQVFRATCVLTTRAIREKEQAIQGIPFILKHVASRVMFGTKPIWRDSVKIDVTNPAKTIVDMLDDPAIGGGIRHVADCLANYLRDKEITPDRTKAIDELIATATRLGNGAVFKRLGFLAESLGDKELATNCKNRLSKGNAKLDPDISCPKLITRWRLWIPANWKENDRNDRTNGNSAARKHL